jgi:hypothetical protein
VKNYLFGTAFPLALSTVPGAVTAGNKGVASFAPHREDWHPTCQEESVARDGQSEIRRANMTVKKNNKPATKESKKGKKISGKKELAKAKTLFSTRSLYKPGL